MYDRRASFAATVNDNQILTDRAGFRYWFADADIMEVNDNNEPFQQTSPEVELFYTYFRKPERLEAYILLSSSEIADKIAEKIRLPLTNISVNVIGKWLYCVVELNFDQVEGRRRGF